MHSDKVIDALNEQLNQEMYSSNMYRAMQAYFMHQNLSGFANWVDVQAVEENFHARKIFDFMNERSYKVRILTVAAPPSDWESALAALTDAYNHECALSKRFYEIYKLADSEGDIATRVFLQWFINEQVEEESNADQVVQRLKMVQDSPAGMYMLDREMAARVSTVPASTAAQLA
jgi:ferritin